MSRPDSEPQPPRPTLDWVAIRQSEAFVELATRRGRFVRTSAIVLLGWFAVFLVVIGVSPGLAGTVVFAGMSVGYLLGLSQFVLAWLLTWRYLRLSKSVFAPLEDRVRAMAAADAAAVETPGSAP